jgi:hypothetical protein
MPDPGPVSKDPAGTRQKAHKKTNNSIAFVKFLTIDGGRVLTHAQVTLRAHHTLSFKHVLLENTIRCRALRSH